jgi:simple sugar transport system permease protein
MNWNLILQWSFLIALITAGIRLAIPVLLAVLGEIITERAGILNLGLEGIMAIGGLTGFSVAYYLENGILRGYGGEFPAWLGLISGMLAGSLMGLLMSFLSITLRAEQVISGITLGLLGVGISDFLYRQGLSSMTARVSGMATYPIPLLSKIPVVGEILFIHTPPVYLTVFIVIAVWWLLYKTTLGLQIRAVGENPSSADTSGVNVERVRYIATLLGSALVGLGGAVLTVVQLKLYREGIISGRGWIAVALVIFARWHPWQALLGALLFGVADSLQYRIQALGQVESGATTIPYEFLLMLPYILTLVALLTRSHRNDKPSELGIPYIKGSR